MVTQKAESIVARNVPMHSPLSVYMAKTCRHSRTRPDPVVIPKNKMENIKNGGEIYFLSKKNKQTKVEACFLYAFFLSPQPILELRI